MKKSAKWIVGLVILVGFAFIYAHIDKLHAIYNENVDNSTYLNTGILNDVAAEQEFTVTEEKLDGIQIKCATFGERNEVNLEYILTDKDSGDVIRNGNIAGKDVKNNKFLKIMFDPVTGTKGKTYAVSITETGAKENDGVVFYLENSQKGTSYTINGEQRDGNLIIRTVHHRFDLETFIMVLFFEVYLLIFMKVMYKLFK
ncbi:MAG: hypothetical protein U0I51_04400 [Muricomes sp.]|uniref:hypothetical protein n=1 Tax=Faecalicatena contorta TaxID=39482 RepID=UPI002EC06023|nr:hypothetical protein [Muricomes sp.]